MKSNKIVVFLICAVALIALPLNTPFQVPPWLVTTNGLSIGMLELAKKCPEPAGISSRLIALTEL